MNRAVGDPALVAAHEGSARAAGWWCWDSSRVLRRSSPGDRTRCFVLGYVLMTLGCSAPAPSMPVPRPPPAAPDVGPIEIDGALRPPLFRYATGAGGTRDASSFGPTCAGWIGARPNHRLHVTRMAPFLRIVAVGGLVLDGTTSDLTLVIQGPGGTRCADDGGGGDNPLVEGEFGPGDYEIFVGDNAQGSSAYYRLLVTSERSVTPEVVHFAQSASTPGEVVQEGTLFVRAQVGDQVGVGERCHAVERAVGDGTMRFVWTVRCGDRELYRSLISEPVDCGTAGCLAWDDSMTAADGSPAFVWGHTTIRLSDDASAATGPFSIEFGEVPMDPHAP